MARGFTCLLVAIAAGLSLAQPVARACSIVGFSNYVDDPTLQGIDQTAPVLVAPPAVSVNRGQGPRQNGCSQSVTSCDGLGSVIIGVAVSDDQTPAAKIGYRLWLIEGSPPSGLVLPVEPIVPGLVGQIVLAWDDGKSDDQEPVDFTLGLAALDAAGNQGPVTDVRVQDPGSSGACAIARRVPRSLSPGMAALAALLLVGACARRRSRATP